jgi:hypothetical protein
VLNEGRLDGAGANLGHGILERADGGAELSPGRVGSFDVRRPGLRGVCRGCRGKLGPAAVGDDGERLSPAPSVVDACVMGLRGFFAGIGCVGSERVGEGLTVLRDRLGAGGDERVGLGDGLTPGAKGPLIFADGLP